MLLLFAVFFFFFSYDKQSSAGKPVGNNTTDARYQHFTQQDL